MSNLGVTELALIIVFVIACVVLFTLWPYWRIFKKAGFSPALSLLLLVPIANIVIIFYLAFADWPALKNNEPPQP